MKNIIIAILILVIVLLIINIQAQAVTTTAKVEANDINTCVEILKTNGYLK